MAVPADLLTLTARNKLTVGEFLVSTPEQDNRKWRWASPINHIRPDGPPVLLLHGADDDSVAPSQSIHFAQLYAEAGASPEVHILDNAPHAFWNYYPWFNDSMERAAAFFLQLAKTRELANSNAVAGTEVSRSLPALQSLLRLIAPLLPACRQLGS
jgi:acetyl esterase/lipase